MTSWLYSAWYPLTPVWISLPLRAIWVSMKPAR